MGNYTRFIMTRILRGTGIFFITIQSYDYEIGLATRHYNFILYYFRVTIAGTVSTEMVSVYFCDYGDLALFATKELRPIPAKAPLARSLPPQAIKARLYGLY